MVKRASSEGFSFGTGIGLKDISRFTRQFSAMNQAGLPLIQCLDILSEQTENPKLAQRIRKISADIQGGGTLAESMEKHKPVFTELYCQMVRAGVDGVLRDLRPTTTPDSDDDNRTQQTLKHERPS